MRQKILLFFIQIHPEIQSLLSDNTSMPRNNMLHVSVPQDRHQAPLLQTFKNKSLFSHAVSSVVRSH